MMQSDSFSVTAETLWLAADRPTSSKRAFRARCSRRPAEPAYRPNVDKVRARLEKLLAEARAAQVIPWEPSQLSLYRLIFPQMTLWLAEDEALQYRLAFDAEMERLALSA